MIVKTLDRICFFLFPTVVLNFIARFTVPVAIVSIAGIMVLSFLLGQLITTPIHLSQSSFHIGYSEWFNAGGCR